MARTFATVVGAQRPFAIRGATAPRLALVDRDRPDHQAAVVTRQRLAETLAGCTRARRCLHLTDGGLVDVASPMTPTTLRFNVRPPARLSTGTAVDKAKANTASTTVELLVDLVDPPSRARPRPPSSSRRRSVTATVTDALEAVAAPPSVGATLIRDLTAQAHSAPGRRYRIRAEDARRRSPLRRRPGRPRTWSPSPIRPGRVDHELHRPSAV